MDININIIGIDYNSHDMVHDNLIEKCDGFLLTDSSEYVHTFKCGDEFRGGKIIDCFVHYESECVFMICKCKCNGLYFSANFSGYKEYKIIE